MWERADPMRLYRLPAAYLGSLKAIPGDVMKNATICSITFSPDGRFLAVGYIHDKQARVGVIPLADMGKFVSLFRSRKYMAYHWLAWSPDSRHIAFIADADKFPHPKTNNIVVVALPKELLDAHAGWSPDSLPAKKDPSRK